MSAPSRKWLVATITSASALAVAVIQAGGFTTATEIVAVGFVATAASSYLVRNPEPGDTDALPAVAVKTGTIPKDKGDARA